MTAKLRVLLIEDVAPMAELLRVVIDSTGLAQVGAIAEDLSQARVELYRRRPDLVILDTVLGTESGLDLVQELIEIEVPFVIVFASEGASESAPESMGPLAGVQQRLGPSTGVQGALGFLEKPEWDGKRVRAGDVELFSQFFKTLKG